MAEPKDSFGRCLLNANFIKRFYEIFVNSHPDIKPIFKNTDWVKQNELLRKGITCMISFEHNDPVSVYVLDRIGKTHSSKELNIDPKLYPYWVESLISAVKENDPKFSAEVESAWRRVIDKGIKYILSKY